MRLCSLAESAARNTPERVFALLHVHHALARAQWGLESAFSGDERALQAGGILITSTRPKLN